MTITQKPVKELTNEEFIEAYKSNLIKFNLVGSNFDFKSLLQICLQNGIMTMQRVIELNKIYYRK